LKVVEVSARLQREASLHRKVMDDLKKERADTKKAVSEAVFSERLKHRVALEEVIWVVIGP
jgi:hypothetical protein